MGGLSRPVFNALLLLAIGCGIYAAGRWVVKYLGRID